MSKPESLLAPHLLADALAVRDLTDPSQGPHAVQRVLDAAVQALSATWRCEVALHRASPVVPATEPAEGADPEEPALALPPVSASHVLRAETSAMIPPVLRLLATAPPEDVLLVCPGVVFRRAGDALRPQPASEVDLWRVRRGPRLGLRDLAAMIGSVARAVAPGFTLSAISVRCTLLAEARQLDLRVRGAWVRIGRCGLVQPGVLLGAGLPEDASGVALTLDLDRLVMLAKGTDDRGLLWSDDPRTAARMLDLAPWVPVGHEGPSAPGAAADSAREGAGAPPADDASLDEVRASIDAVDARIVELLAERRGYALEAARFKRSLRDPRVPLREEQVVANVRARARQAGIEADLVEGLYRHLMDDFVRLQRTAQRAGAAGEPAGGSPR